MNGEAVNPERQQCFFAQAGDRLDVACAKASGQTRSFVHKLIEAGRVSVNGAVVQKAGAKLSVGDGVAIAMPAPEAVDSVKPENIPLNIVYQDQDMIIVDKPQGMVVHPAPGNYAGTLVNALMYHMKDLSGIGGELRPGIVHRIDKMTSGLLVAAKNDFAHRALSAQMKAHTAFRTYVAIVEGNLREESGTISANICRHPVDRKRMAVCALGGREAVTHYDVLARFGDFTLVALRLETGRTHQIRVHMAHCNHPIAGDTTYGAKKPKLGLNGQALHAIKLELTHPGTRERMAFFSQLPPYFKDALERIGAADIDAMIPNSLKSEKPYEKQR